MPRFAFCDVAPLGCPGCGGTGFYNGEPIVWLRVGWGLAVAQRPVPGFDYEVGDPIRWRACLDGTVLPWTFFRDSSVNIGDPALLDVTVVDRTAQTCPACGAAIGGVALEIRGGVIEAARLFLEDEFGDDDLVDVFQVSPDGSWSPVQAPDRWGRATSECGPIEAIKQIPRAAVAVVLPPPSRHWSTFSSIPPGWLTVAQQWVAPTGEESVWAASMGTEVRLSPDGMTEFVDRQGSAIFLSGHPPAQSRAAVIRHWRTAAELILAGGGSDADISNVVAELRDVVDHLAPEVALAYVSIEPTFEAAVTDTQLSDEEKYDEEGLYRPRSTVNEVCDEAILDAYHHQVLGPGHVARLGAPPAGSKALAGGRVGLTLGSPADWEPGSPARDEQRRHGRALLAPLLLGQRRLGELITGPSEQEIRDLGFTPRPQQRDE